MQIKITNKKSKFKIEFDLTKLKNKECKKTNLIKI